MGSFRGGVGQVPTVLLGYSSTPRSNGTTGLQVPVRCVHVGGGEIVGKTKLWLFVFLVRCETVCACQFGGPAGVVF